MKRRLGLVQSTPTRSRLGRQDARYRATRPSTAHAQFRAYNEAPAWSDASGCMRLPAPAPRTVTLATAATSAQLIEQKAQPAPAPWDDYGACSSFRHRGERRFSAAAENIWW